MIRLPALVVALLAQLGPSQEIQLTDAVVLQREGQGGRAPIQTSDILHRWAVDGFDAPDAGDPFQRADGSTDTWEAETAGEDGWLHSRALRGGFANFTIELDEPRTYLLDARSHSMAIVNGAPRGGNPYGFGYTRLPVRLEAGRNDLAFFCGRGQVWARLIPVEAEFDLLHEDRTLPDLIVGEPTDTPIGIIVLNASQQARDDLVIRTSIDGAEPVETPVGWLEGVSPRKVAALIAGKPPSRPGEARVVAIALLDGDGGVLAEDEITLIIKSPSDKHVRTFVSDIDGSCQYFAITPRRGEPLAEGEAPGLILTLHGASVEGRGQAAAYDHKNWADIVAPTNRRPYGFDWEDWGRKDAIEVLDLASDLFGSDPRRTYLTGHSMGGHGAWHVGASFPGRFAAIAPSAGWVSFWSYTGAARYEEAGGIESILTRASSPSETLELERNLDGLGVYVLHGDRDDNVSVGQARTMRERLGAFHGDFAYYEQPGAGHWWGNQCVDWPELMAFLERRARPERIDRVRFSTMSPAVSAQRDWVTIVQQERSLERSSVDLAVDRESGTIRGTTQNVSAISLDLAGAGLEGEVIVELDGAESVSLSRADSGSPLASVTLEKRDAGWRSTPEERVAGKRPDHMGPFKEIFDRRAVLVYGTRGGEAETAQSRAKALFDAETFWYRGNGSLLVIPDTEYDAARYAGRNVILYGNADTNSAWNKLLADSPVRIASGSATIGDRAFDGDDLGLLLVRPHPDGQGLVGVVGASGPAGARAIEHLPVFVSGVAYPDATLMRAGSLIDGTDGVEAAGFFGNDWSVEAGDFVFGE